MVCVQKAYVILNFRTQTLAETAIKHMKNLVSWSLYTVAVFIGH